MIQRSRSSSSSLSFIIFFALFSCLLISNISSTSISTRSPNDSHHADSAESELTAAKLYKLDENPLRIGFEPFYKFTNMFIDNLMSFELSKDLVDYLVNLSKSNVTMERLREHPSQLFEDLKRVYNQTDNLKFMIYFPFSLSTNFMILLIVSALFIVVIPVVGLFFCICRLGCAGKFNPYDRKYDSAKRKFYAAIIFVFMVALLLGSVILFFTNQNANNAIQKTQEIVISAFRRYETLSTKDTKNYLDLLTGNFQSIKENSDPLVKTFSTKFSDDMLREVNDLIKDVDAFLDNKNLTSSLEKDVNSIKTDLLSFKDQNQEQLNSKIDEIVATLSITDSLKQLDSFSVVLDQFKQMKANFTQTEAIEKMLNGFINDNLDKTIDQIKDVSSLLENNHSVTISNARENSVKVAQIIQTNYEHVYMILMGVSVFMLLWFILYSTGLAGLCARRANETYSQFFHRGISANLLMTGVGFFFLFSSILVAICVILYTPGIITRQFISRPLIKNNENLNGRINDQNINKLINVLLPQLNESFNIYETINECRQNKTILNLKSRSQLLKLFLKFDLEDLVSAKKIVKDSVIVKEVKKFQSILNNKNNEFKKIKETIEKFVDQLTTNQFDEKLNSIKDEISLFKDQINLLGEDRSKNIIKLNRLEDNIDKLMSRLDDLEKNQKTKLRSIRIKVDKVLDDLSDDTLIQSRLKQTINETVSQLVMNDLLMADKSPSCRPVAEIYDDIVKTYFFEFLDNFNTYWFILLLSVGVHLIVIGFAIELAGLLRKHYAYDEVLTEDLMMEDTKYDGNNNYPDGQLKDLYNVKSPNRLIDAYEISNMNRKTHAKSPPPQYRVPNA